MSLGKATRQTDRSAAVARAAIASTVHQFDAWWTDLAMFTVQVERSYSPQLRAAMLARCVAISRELQDARATMIVNLMDAPRKVVGHSRVADVEKALDGIEATLRRIRGRLETAG